MQDIIIDTLLDTVKLLPFLFVAFLIIELIEHKLSDKSKNIVKKSGSFGPFFGGVLGSLPQCGFSVIATNLYITRIATLGTLFAIYLSTSDELIPVLLSHNIGIVPILKIVGLKVIIGIVCGFLIDFVIRKREHESFDICEETHCECQTSIFKSSIIHTIKIAFFIALISFILNILFHYVPENIIEKIFLSNSIFGPLLGSLIGLIPNCGASVMISELYLKEVISFGTTMAGLLTGSGVAILVLFKSNKNLKENLMILGGLYIIGAISGIIIDVILRFL